MGADRVWTAAELELMSPNERAQVIQAGMLTSLNDLDPEFRERVQAKSRRLIEQYGLLEPDS